MRVRLFSARYPGSGVSPYKDSGTKSSNSVRPTAYVSLHSGFSLESYRGLSVEDFSVISRSFFWGSLFVFEVFFCGVVGAYIYFRWI